MNPNNKLQIGEFFKIKNVSGYIDVSPANIYEVFSVTEDDRYCFRDDAGQLNRVLCADAIPLVVNNYMVVRAIDAEIDYINKEIEKSTVELRAKIEALKTTRKIFTS